MRVKYTITTFEDEKGRYYDFSNNPYYVIYVPRHNIGIAEDRITAFQNGEAKECKFRDIAEFIKK